jgi:hypothetical protein
MRAGVKIVLHDCLLDKALASTENFFQAAKSLLEADARFYFELNGGDAARYGQGRMYLTTKQKVPQHPPTRLPRVVHCDELWPSCVHRVWRYINSNG